MKIIIYSRKLVRALACKIQDAEDKSAYPHLTTEEMVKVIDDFLKSDIEVKTISHAIRDK